MQEINLYRLLAFYVRNWLLIVSLTLIGLLGGLVYNTFVQKPLYKSDATILFINSESTNSTQDTTQINNYVELFKSRRVLDPALQDQKIGISYDQFAGSVDAVNEKGTEVIKVSVKTNNPAVSRDFLHEAILSFKQQAQNLYGKDNLSIVDSASDAQPPFNVNKGKQLLISIVTGFAVSLIVLFFIYDVKGDAIKPRVKKTIETKKKSSAVSVKDPVFIRMKDSITGMFTRKTVKPVAKKPTAKKAPASKGVKTTNAKTTTVAKTVPAKKATVKKPAAKKTPAKKTTTK